MSLQSERLERTKPTDTPCPFGSSEFSDFKITVTAFFRPLGRIGKRNNRQEKHGKKNVKVKEMYMMRRVKRR